jgi:phosphoglycolate phosphatase-like HAD superfamily hydrolase
MIVKLMSFFRYFWLFLILLNLNPVFSNNTSISGRIEAPENRRVAIYFIEDYLTFTLRKIKEIELDKNDFFSTEIDIEDIKHVVIRCGNVAGKFFAEPSIRYAFILTKPEPGEALSKGRVTYLRLKLKEKKSSPLNTNITNINVDIDSILIKYQKEIIFNQFKEPFLEAKTFLNEKYARINDDFTKDYLKYSIGVLELIAYRKSQKRLYNEYLHKIDPKYNNPAYMDFLSKFYHNHFNSYILSKKNQGFAKDLSLNNYFVALRLMETDSLYKDPILREIAVVKGISDVYYESFLPKPDLLSFLKYIIENGNSKEVKQIAKNTYHKLGKFNSGREFPNLKLKDKDGKSIDNSIFEGKFTYYHFWAPWNIMNFDEFQVLQKLYKKHGQKVNFVSISPYMSTKELANFLNSNPFEWTFATMDYYDDVLMNLEINITPHFFLTYPNGKIALAPAPYPSVDGKTLLDEVVKNPKKEFTIGIK